MKKVLLYGCYNGDNLGDDLILEAVYGYLNKNNIDISIFCTNPEGKNYFNLKNKYHIVGQVDKTGNDLLAKVKHKVSVLKQYIHKRNKQYDCIIFVGGGYINGIFGLKNLIKIYLLTRSFKKYNKKIFFTGQTVGPFKNRISEKLTKNIYKSANKIIVREKYSKKILDEWKLNNVLVGDDAYLLKQKNNEEKCLSNSIIINVKDFKGYERWENKYIEIIKEVVKNGENKVYFIPFRSDVNSKEYKTNLKLAEQLKKYHINSEIFVPFTIQELLEIYSESKFVIGTAYHSIVLALLSNKEPYSFYAGEYYERKIKGVLSLYGLEEKNCANFEINEQVNSMIKKIGINKLGKNTSIKNRTNQIKGKLYKTWDEIIKEINL